ncbi:MAG: adenylate/guanylate cyclase domain-containing protein [Rhodospirillales bacterium]|nr:adenylate/guanylate cyclase domain-containing protein [Rhodospirillales bacterium]
MQQFYELMESYARADTDDARQQIQDQVWDQYGVEETIQIIDMSGFSRLTQKRGIVHYLSMVRHMQLVTQPIIIRYGGTVVKYEADNGFCRFPTVEKAVDASIAINIAFDAMNMMTPDDLNIYISCGIDYGRFLLVDENDYFGVPVNVASKLSEDIGGPGDILVTQTAMDLLPEGVAFKCESKFYEISGFNIAAQRVIF